MDEVDSQNQIQQMISFILNEAKDKAEEIESGALEDFNIEKMNIFQQKKGEIKAKLLRNFSAKQLEKNKARNAALMDLRNKVLKRQCELVDNIHLEALQQLTDLASDKDSYSQILALLILTGAFTVCSDKLLLKARAKDASLIVSLLPRVQQEFKSLVENLPGVTCSLNVQLDETNSLPDDSIGVIVTDPTGKIECDCTLNTRLQRCFRLLTPHFKHELFQPLGIKSS